MPGVREIFGSDESDSEDDESDVQRSQAHAIFGPSDPLFVVDLDGDLAMPAGGDYHGTVTLARMAPNSVSAAPRRDGTGFERRADDELSERPAARSGGLGAVHATSPTAPTVPQEGGQLFLLLQLRWREPPKHMRQRECHMMMMRGHWPIGQTVARRAQGFHAVVAMTTTTMAATRARRRRPEALLTAPPQVRDRIGKHRRALHTPLERASAVLAQHV